MTARPFLSSSVLPDDDRANNIIRSPVPPLIGRPRLPCLPYRCIHPCRRFIDRGRPISQTHIPPFCRHLVNNRIALHTKVTYSKQGVRFACLATYAICHVDIVCASASDRDTRAVLCRLLPILHLDPYQLGILYRFRVFTSSIAVTTAVLVIDRQPVRHPPPKALRNRDRGFSLRGDGLSNGFVDQCGRATTICSGFHSGGSEAGMLDRNRTTTCTCNPVDTWNIPVGLRQAVGSRVAETQRNCLRWRNPSLCEQNRWFANCKGIGQTPFRELSARSSTRYSPYDT